eukprot:2154869-Pleurochrysis_carterae.AAC.1
MAVPCPQVCAEVETLLLGEYMCESVQALCMPCGVNALYQERHGSVLDAQLRRYMEKVVCGLTTVERRLSLSAAPFASIADTYRLFDRHHVQLDDCDNSRPDNCVSCGSGNLPIDELTSTSRNSRSGSHISICCAMCVSCA